MPQVPQYSPVGEALRVKVLSYNPEWWHVIEQLGGNSNSAAQLISLAGRAQPFDIIGFQEFYDPWWGLTRPGYDASELLRDYAYVRGEPGGPVGTVIGFRNESWSLLGKGQRFVAEDEQGPMYFGKRIALWARLWHRQSGHTVFFMNHHGPLPVNSGGVCGGDVTAHNLAQVVVDNAAPGDAVILVGDFNADASSQTVSQLDTVLHHTFSGIDHIFTNVGEERVACRAALGNGGSDHDAINVVLNLPGADGGDPAGPANCEPGR
jgi:endonuclease/exonuclease/phosphatase family metal-dependent hydrolase